MPSRATQIVKPGVYSVADIRDLLGPPPILSGEDSGAYEALHDQIRTAVTPKDVLEEIWVRDVADLVWEALRLRRLKATLFSTQAHRGLGELLKPLVDYNDRHHLVESWARREASGVAKVNAILKKAKLNDEAITAETFAISAETFEKIDRLITQVEVRRNAMLREIDRHRDALGQRLRDATLNLLPDGEFKEIENAKAPTNETHGAHDS
jgi:hypothetical protein